MRYSCAKYCKIIGFDAVDIKGDGRFKESTFI
jgi:hypothetical protein